MQSNVSRIIHLGVVTNLNWYLIVSFRILSRILEEVFILLYASSNLFHWHSALSPWLQISCVAFQSENNKKQQIPPQFNAGHCTASPDCPKPPQRASKKKRGGLKRWRLLRTLSVYQLASTHCLVLTHNLVFTHWLFSTHYLVSIHLLVSTRVLVRILHLFATVL
jgi:hypothetical protein